MSDDVVTEARRLLNNAEDTNVHYTSRECSCGTCAFEASAHNLVRGLLAEVDRLRDGGSMASAPRKDAASQAAEPAVLHASIDPPAAASTGGTPMREEAPICPMCGRAEILAPGKLVPHKGQRIRVWGIARADRDHSWPEVHPIEGLELVE